ncbi:MAG: hypothetical protein F6K24_29900 [Okeania sp. SIO2D1]|nr:hypothetical protein [Okeania sp. SIO2D1]
MKYLLDENLPPLYQQQLLEWQPDLVVVAIGDKNVPPKGKKDPEILRSIQDNGFILVTNNRSSMPVHLAELLAESGHVPGILVLRPGANIGRVIEDLIAIAGASFEDEYRDQIAYIPLI